VLKLGRETEIDMGDWVDGLFDDKYRRDKQRELAKKRKAAATNYSATVMFPALCGQIKRDIQKYKKRSGDDIDVSDGGGSLVLHRGIFPHFHLELKRGCGPLIRIELSRQESRNSEVEDLDDVVEVIAGAKPDQWWFNYQGINYPNESEVSEAILLPLLQNQP